jgi:hypothetical protein
MKTDLVYVELKSGYSDAGPAWIGRPSYSKSRSTIYFNKLALKKTHSPGSGGNYYESDSGDDYWVSGVKKNGEDRHWAGGGKILIDSQCIDEYLSFLGQKFLPNNIVPSEFESSKIPTDYHKKENERLE